jgi:O-antigen ligase
MPTGVTWSLKHTDITNYYIKMGVLGGLPLMLLFIAILVGGFVAVSRILRRRPDLPIHDAFFVWTLGAVLFGHGATFISVTYFDQSIVFLYLNLAAISSIYSLPSDDSAETELDPSADSARDMETVI